MAQDPELISALRKIINQHTISTQTGLCDALHQAGFEVSQAKISRLLHHLKVNKVKGPTGELTYQLAKEPDPPSQHPALSLLVAAINHNENMIVLHTSPGAAPLLARMIDFNKDRLAVLGTIAGDDTIFISPKSCREIQTAKTLIEKFLWQNTLNYKR